MSRLVTVDSLVEAVRSQLHETNVEAVDTVIDILPALNRAQDFAVDIYSRYYPDPYLTHAVLTLSGGTQEYDIPDEAFEDRILKVEMSIGNSLGRPTYREVQRIAFTDISNYESASVSSIPYYYAVVGRKIRFVPVPSGTYNSRIWYIREPEKMVLQQGRVTVINITSNYLVVDQLGGDLQTTTDQLQSYINVIDGSTGEIRSTHQIQSLTGNRITIRTTPARSSVLGRTVTGVLPDTIEKDDYVCVVEGSCVPFLNSPTSNFAVQYAVNEMTRKLGGDVTPEVQMLKDLEDQVTRTWTGRETTLRVTKRSPIFGVTTRRLFWE